jgi:hypothetical protein
MRCNDETKRMRGRCRQTPYRGVLRLEFCTIDINIMITYKSECDLLNSRSDQISLKYAQSAPQVAVLREASLAARADTL